MCGMLSRRDRQMGSAPYPGLRVAGRDGVCCHHAGTKSEEMPVPIRNVVLTERQADLIETLVEFVPLRKRSSEVLRRRIAAGGATRGRRMRRIAEGPAITAARVGLWCTGSMGEFAKNSEIWTSCELYLNEPSQRGSHYRGRRIDPRMRRADVWRSPLRRVLGQTGLCDMIVKWTTEILARRQARV